MHPMPMTRKWSVPCLAGCLWVALNVSPSAQAQDLATELLFAEGLQGRGYLDLAEKHLDALLAGPWSVTDKAAINYTFAELLEKMAEQVLKKDEIPMLNRLALREGYLSKAETCWRTGLKLNPVHEKAASARFAIGTLLKLRAQNKKRNWEKLEDELERIGPPPQDLTKLSPEEKAEEVKKNVRRETYKHDMEKEKKEALELLKESVQYFSEMAKAKEKVVKDCQDQLGKEKRPEVLDKLQKQEEKAQEERVQACFEWYSNLIFLAEVIGPETQDGQKYLQEAVKSLKALSGEFPNWLVSKYAMMLEGYGHCLLKNYALGFKRFDEIIGEDEEADALHDVIQKTYYRFADCARKADPKTYPKECPPRNQLTVYMIEGLVYRVTPEEARQRIGLKEIAARFGRNPEILMRLNNMRSYTVDGGQKVIIYRGLFTRFEGLEQEPIGKAATLLLAEAYVNWGLEMRGMKSQPKEWRAKVRTGLAYAEKVAQGDEPWAYKANTLLAKWSDLMKEVNYVSPVQVYARATTAFFEANRVAKAQQRPLYEDAIYYFQRVIELCGEEGESEGAKSALDDEKVADSWFKMGAAYFVLKRVPEAALCWNACARDFPKDSKSGKAAELSTQVMGQIYSGEKDKDGRKTLGYFYADMLADFVRLYPESPKAANSQFYLAEVHRAREDYLGAAAAYEKVPAISQFYDQGFYLVGVCCLNYFHGLFQAGKGDTEEAKSVLGNASEKIEAFTRWVEENPGDGEIAPKRIELQARAVLNRAKIHLFDVTKDPDKTIKLLEGYEAKYEQALPEKVKAELFPDAVFTRLKAFVMKEELGGAIKELDMLLEKYPKSADVVNGFKYVAGVYLKEAEKKEKEIEGPKKELEGKQAKVEELTKAGKKEEVAALEKEIKGLKDKTAAPEAEAGALRVRAADLYYKLIAKAPKQDCSIYLFSADTYFVNRVFDKAAAMYGRFLAQCEKDPKFANRTIEIKQRLGESLYQLNEYEKALQFLSLVEASTTDKAKRFGIRPMINRCSKALGLKLMQDPKNKEEAAKQFTNALNGWAILKNNIQPLTEEWWEATYEIGDILYWTEGYDKALGHLGSHILMYPQMGGPNWKPKFLDLSKRLKGKLKKPADVQKIDEIIEKLSK